MLFRSLALLFVLLAAWLFRLTSFGNNRTWVNNATVGPIPGYIVIASVAAFYIGILWIAFRPHPRRSKENFDRGNVEEGAWKDSERE
mgnify:FL=1